MRESQLFRPEPECRFIEGVGDGKRIEVGLRNRSGLADEVARAEVPPEVGVLQRKDAEQEREGQKRRDQRPIRQTTPQVTTGASAGGFDLALARGFAGGSRTTSRQPRKERRANPATVLSLTCLPR